jgi:hypothetical protein
MARLEGGSGRSTGFQNQPRQAASLAFLRAQEVGAFFHPVEGDLDGSARVHGRSLFGGQAESLLRPWARRRARTWRPFLVAMRLRKPWRRLRTSLLG